jgi:tRNA modification GTPase
VTETAACKGEGLAQLQNVLETMFNTNSIDLSSGIIANERQRDCVKRAVSLVDEALQAVRAGETLDAVTIYSMRLKMHCLS